MQADSVARLALYDAGGRRGRSVASSNAWPRGSFRTTLWRDIRSRYGERIERQLDAELYKTFFNTISRRLFKTRGVDPAIEFIALDIEPTDRITHPVARHTYAVNHNLKSVFSRVSWRPVVCESFCKSRNGMPSGWQFVLRRFLPNWMRRWFPSSCSKPCSIVRVVPYLVGRALGEGLYRPCVVAH